MSDKPSHTKEPWRSQGDEVHDSRMAVDEDGVFQGDRPNMIAKVEYPHDDLARREAIARLFAKAPELVEAIKNARLEIDYLHAKFKETGSGSAMLARIDSLLAEIEGGGE